MGPDPGCSHLRPLCFQDLGRGQVLPPLGLCLGLAALEKPPKAGLSATHPRGWGQPPTRGQLLIHNQMPQHPSYHHRSHTMTTAIHTTTTPLSHTLLSHTQLSHYDHRSHTMSTSTGVSRRNGTKALPPARLPGARNPEPTQSQGAPW